MSHPEQISRELYRSILDQVGQMELPDSAFVGYTVEGVEQFYTKRGTFMVDRAKTALYTMSDTVIPENTDFVSMVALAAEQFALAQTLVRSCQHLLVRGVGTDVQYEAALNMRDLARDIESFYAQAEVYKNVDDPDGSDLLDLLGYLHKAQARVWTVEATYRIQFSAVRDMRMFTPRWSHNLSGIDGNA